MIERGGGVGGNGGRVEIVGVQGEDIELRGDGGSMPWGAGGLQFRGGL